jgi:hypothetical protein
MPLPFYRDRDGAEVDLVLQRRGRRLLVEAKSAQTAGRSLFDGARRVQAQLSGDSIPSDPIVVYGGAAAQRRTEGRLVPWGALHQMPWNP